MSVLISTYWNVNYFAFIDNAEENPVLISTYWNVNNDTTWGNRPSGSFNLNLLECKFCIIVAEKIEVKVLISTYWNVNDCGNT